jgi:ferredoxin
MPRPTPILEKLTIELDALGLALRGGFALGAEEGLPSLADGRPARFLLLLGNVGGAMWPAFAATRPSPDRPSPDRPDPLDDWTRTAIDPIAARLGARALYPFEGPPYFPFQRWAQRAEAVFPSPLMIYIHPRHGLWHAYRAALLLPDVLPLPAPETAARPCDSCVDQPCLHSCPVGAFTGTGFDDMACARHVDGPDGAECRDHGCRARRACPVGADQSYPPAQMAFHMEAFLARRRHLL